MNIRYEIILSKEAEFDIEEGVEWYDSTKRGLGFEFAYRIEEKFELIEEHPFMYAEIYKDIRRVLLKKFPYAIFYYVSEEQKEINVFAIINTQRNPRIWKGRVK